jgi:hypothetical protein
MGPWNQGKTHIVVLADTQAEASDYAPSINAEDGADNDCERLQPPGNPADPSDDAGAIAFAMTVVFGRA